VSMPITNILIGALESEPARAEVCHILEKTILEAMSTSPKQMTPQGFISLRLCQDSSTQCELTDHPINSQHCFTSDIYSTERVVSRKPFNC
jgi:hypothetical protein